MGVRSVSFLPLSCPGFPPSHHPTVYAHGAPGTFMLASQAEQCARSVAPRRRRPAATDSFHHPARARPASPQ
jgi:hypothetical protein